MLTTLNKIRSFSPCSSGWKTLLNHLGKTKADDEVFNLSIILNSNGLNDTLWCFRAVDGFVKEKQLFVLFCAKQALPYMKDERSVKAIEGLELYIDAKITEDEVKALMDAAAYADSAYAARAAYADSAYAAYAAAYSARAYSDAREQQVEYLKELLK